MKKTWNLLDEIRFRWTIFKYTRGLTKHDITWKWVRTNLCRRGFHKIHVGQEKEKVNDGKWKTVRFLRCIFCNYMFFASAKEKHRYENKYKRKRKKTREMFSVLLNKTSGSLSETDSS